MILLSMLVRTTIQKLTLSTLPRALCPCANSWHKNDFHKNEHAADTLSSEMFHTKTLLSTEADGNSEMAHFLTVNKIYNDLLRKVALRLIALIVL